MFTAKHLDAFFMWLVSKRPVFVDRGFRAIDLPEFWVAQFGLDVDVLELFMTCKDFYAIFERNADHVYSAVGHQYLYRSESWRKGLGRVEYEFCFGRRRVCVTVETTGCAPQLRFTTFRIHPSREYREYYIPYYSWECPMFGEAASRLPTPVLPISPAGKNINARDFIRELGLKLLR
jgi:hypothetical protein